VAVPAPGEKGGRGKTQKKREATHNRNYGRLTLGEVPFIS
jgi:hypothetical protein